MIKSPFNCSVNKKNTKTTHTDIDRKYSATKNRSDKNWAGVSVLFLVVASQACLPVTMLRFDHKAFVPAGGALFVG